MNDPMSDAQLILASRSPRRVELLRAAGYDFDIDPADINEDRVPPGLSPRELAVYLATEKARVVAGRHPGSIVLGADTIVAVGEELFGKAATPDAARAMLTALAGKQQEVITGVAIFGRRMSPNVAAASAMRTPASAAVAAESAAAARAVVSVVSMTPMAPAQLNSYIASGAWRGKAGAYGIQDHDPSNDPFVRIVSGDYTNVVGLPMDAVREMLAAVGIHPTAIR